MNKSQFYQKLRSFDQDRVSAVVEELKQQKFQPYAVGNSLDSYDYNNIKLLIEPSFGTTVNDLKGDLEHFILDFKRKSSDLVLFDEKWPFDTFAGKINPSCKNNYIRFGSQIMQRNEMIMAKSKNNGIDNVYALYIASLRKIFPPAHYENTVLELFFTSEPFNLNQNIRNVPL